jgi:DNA-binding transcriptional MerR regulator
MQIGAIAKKIGLSVDAIRFYERNSLLPRPPRTQGGFRKYGESDVETLGFIRRAQGLGFTLSEVRELLALRKSRLQPCAAGWNKRPAMFAGNLRTFANWSTSCVRRCGVAIERCASGPHIVRCLRGRS